MACGICGQEGHNRNNKKFHRAIRRGPLMRIPPSGAGRKFDLPVGTLSGRGRKRKGMKGGGLLSTIKKVKDFILGLSKGAQKAFQVAANAYRLVSCRGKARPLMLGELHPGCQGFSGPGTRIDLPEVLNYPAYNDIDACSKQHDIEYEEYFKIKDEAKRRKLIRQSDLKALKCYERFKNQESYREAHGGISSKIYLEDKFPFVAKKLLGVYFGSNK